MGDDRVRVLFLVLFLNAALFAGRDGGPYVSVGGVRAMLEDNGFYGIDTARKATSALFCAGAYINEYFSTEIEYFPSMEFQTANDVTFTWSAYDINVQAHYPFYHDKLDMFIKFGAGEVGYKSKGAALVYGIGASYRYDKRYGLRAGYDYFDFGVDTNGDDAKDMQMHIGAFYGVFEVQF